MYTRKTIVALVMVAYVTVLNPLDYNRYSRNFSTRVGQIVPQSEELVAFEYISKRSVHYSGRIIPEIEDKSRLYELYEAGNWVVATAGQLEKLEADGRFRMVYRKEKAERRWGQNVPGIVFHKSAPFIATEP